MSTGSDFGLAGDLGVELEADALVRLDANAQGVAAQLLVAGGGEEDARADA